MTLQPSCSRAEPLSSIDRPASKMYLFDTSAGSEWLAALFLEKERARAEQEKGHRRRFIGRPQQMAVTSDEEKPGRCTVHRLPCVIEHTGEANVGQYFITKGTVRGSFRDFLKPLDSCASFRGRRLVSSNIAIPEGYSCTHLIILI